MQPSNANYQLGVALRDGSSVIPDPGTGNTIDLRGKHLAVGRSWGAGTYKLPLVTADMIGTVFVAIADGAQTYQQANGDTLQTLNSGDALMFVAKSTTSSAAWVAPSTNAGRVSFDDSNEYTTASSVNDALDEIYGHLLYATGGCIDVPLSAFREVDADGDVDNAAANGGVLASDTTPVLEGAGSTNAQRLAWATGNADRIAASVSCPPDMDGTANVIVQFIVASAGTTNSFDTAVLVTNWNGGADVTDALTDTATTAVKVAPGTVAAADVADTPLTVTVSLTPPTHATDILYCYGCRILYKRLILA